MRKTKGLIQFYQFLWNKEAFTKSKLGLIKTLLGLIPLFSKLFSNQKQDSKCLLLCQIGEVVMQRHLPYRRDIYEPLNRKSSRIVRVAAASGMAKESRIVR